MLSYVNAQDGKSYYSMDGGTTFEPLTDEKLEISEKAISLAILLSNGEEVTFGPYENVEELLSDVKPFCSEQVKLGNMKQSEADEILNKYDGK